MERSFFKGLIMGILVGGVISVAVVFAYTKIADNNINQVNVSEDKAGITSLPKDSKFLKKYNEIVNKINAYYLNEKDIDADKIADGMYKGIMTSIEDKYADYYTSEEYSGYKEKYEGQYGGLGAYVAKNSDTGDIVIVNPFADSPAEKAGIKPGDILIAIGDESVEGKELDYAVSLMKGEPGTSITLKIRRDNEEFDTEVTREIIDVPTVAHKVLEGENIGYIYVATFDEVTIKQFDEALTDIESKGCKGVIIDIRDNGGGRLDAAIEMMNRILPDGLMMYTETKKGIDQKFEADSNKHYDSPIAVIINEYSASASEVFAGAMQDRNKAVIVGTKSYGKGVVQSVFPLSETGDGSAIKITTSKYYTPSGRNIDGIGITPDVEVKYDKDRSVNVGDEVRDNQIQEAVKVLKEKIGS